MTQSVKKRSIQTTIKTVTKNLKLCQKVTESNTFNSNGNLYVDTSDYLVLEASDYIDRKKVKEALFLSYPNMDIFVQFMDEVMTWFNQEEYNDLYETYNGEVYVNDKYHNLKLTISDLPGGKQVTVKPIVIVEEVNSAYEGDDGAIFLEGVSIIFNNNIVVELLLEEFEKLRDFINTFDLYGTSLTLYNILLSKLK